MDDYISRAEFVRELDDIIARCNQIGVTDDFQYHELVGEENATKAIRCLAKAFPAADVRPVKKGNWIMHISDLFPADSTMECDQCHEEQPIGIDDNFCPNCGAKMGGADG